MDFIGYFENYVVLLPVLLGRTKIKLRNLVQGGGEITVTLKFAV